MARTQTATLTATDGAEEDLLGASVALDGGTIVAGAPVATVGANERRGSVYTFARAGGPPREQTAELTQSHGADGALFGFSVAIDGPTIGCRSP